MKMLIKDDKIIIAYIGEEGRGHVEGYYYIDVEVSDLKSGEVIDTYSPGYGTVTLIDESKYISFSTMVGHRLMDEKEDKLLYPSEDERDFMINYIGENEKGILINAEYTADQETPGIYLVYSNGEHESVATQDEGIIDGVSTD